MELSDPFRALRFSFHGKNGAILCVVVFDGCLFCKGKNYSRSAILCAVFPRVFSFRAFFSGPLRILIKNYFYICSPETRVSGSVIRRDAGVVDRAALEMRCTGNCTGGSNPSLSASESDSDEVASSGLQPVLFSLLLSGFVTDGPAGLSGLGYLD